MSKNHTYALQVEYDKLCLEIAMLDRRYYNLQEGDNPVPDIYYDNLKAKRSQMEAMCPELKHPGKPPTPGFKPTHGHRTVHKDPVLSIRSIYNHDDYLKWHDSNVAKYGVDFSGSLYGEAKGDGVSLVCYYQDGHLVALVLQGDGSYGECLPLELSNVISGIEATVADPDLSVGYKWVRGEVVVHLDDFQTYNNNPESPVRYHTYHGMVAGMLRSKNINSVMDVPLHFYAHGVDPEVCATTDPRLVLRRCGFKQLDIVDISKRIDFKDLQSRLPYPIDGVVIKVGNPDVAAQMKPTSRDVGYAVAVKPEYKVATATVTGFRNTVGATGRIITTLQVSPVTLAGITYHYVLIGSDFKLEEDLVRVGSTIEIGVKLGVCELLNVVKLGNGFKLKPLSKCMCCSTELEIRNGRLYCPNDLECGGILKAKLKMFVSKGGLDIRGLGPVAIERLYDSGKIKRVDDLYRLTVDDLKAAKVPRADIVHQTLMDTSRISNARLLRALWISGIGKSTADTLIEAFGSLKVIDSLVSMGAGPVTMLIADVGEESCYFLCDWFNRNRGVIRRLLDGPFKELDTQPKGDSKYKHSIEKDAVLKLAIKRNWGPEVVNRTLSIMSEVDLLKP